MLKIRLCVFQAAWLVPLSTFVFTREGIERDKRAQSIIDEAIEAL